MPEITLTDALLTPPKRTPKRVSVTAPDAQSITRVTDPLEALRRIRTAAKLETAPEHVEDCASDIYCRMLAEARETAHTDALRRDRLRMAYLRLEARSWERSRSRDAAHAEATADLPSLADADLAGNPADMLAAPLSFPPAAARSGARQLCTSLGLRTGGKIETAFYAYLRGDDVAQADIAEEIGQTHGAVRNAVSQGGALIAAAYPSPVDLLRALGALADRDLDVRRDSAASERLRNYRRDTWRARADLAPSALRYGHAVPTRLRMSQDRRALLIRRARVAHARSQRAAHARRNAGSGTTPNR